MWILVRIQFRGSKWVETDVKIVFSYPENSKKDLFSEKNFDIFPKKRGGGTIGSITEFYAILKKKPTKNRCKFLPYL